MWLYVRNTREMYTKHSLLLRLIYNAQPAVKIFNMESLFTSKTTKTTTVIVHMQSTEMVHFKHSGLLKE